LDFSRAFGRWSWITADVSKTGRRRIVDIEPNLHAWLTRYIENGGDSSGEVTPLTNLRKRLRDIRAAAHLPEWVQDVARHSYASYWLAHHGDINRLTLQMGHESTDMLWEHYNRAAKRKDAANYWQIKPSAAAARKIVSFGAS
jgi:integrase